MWKTDTADVLQLLANQSHEFDLRQVAGGRPYVKYCKVDQKLFGRDGPATRSQDRPNQGPHGPECGKSTMDVFPAITKLRD